MLVPKEATSRRKNKLTLKDLTEIEPKLKQIIDFYSHKLYDAITHSVMKSLRILAEGSGYKFDMIDEVTDDYYYREDSMLNKTPMVESDELKEDSSDTAKRNFLKIIRIKSSTTHVSSQENYTERAVSTLSTLSKATWSNERKFEESFLKYFFFSFIFAGL